MSKTLTFSLHSASSYSVIIVSGDLSTFTYSYFFCAENSELMKEDLKRQPSMIERLYG